MGWVNWERWARREGGNRLSDRKNRRSGKVWQVWQSTILNISTLSCILVSRNDRIYANFTLSRMLNRGLQVKILNLNSRDTPYVMFDDVYQGSGENLTQIAHEKHIDACYNKLSKVRSLISYFEISILGGWKSKILGISVFPIPITLFLTS